MSSVGFVPNYQAIDKSLERVVEGIPPQLLSYLGLQFQRSISEALGKEVEMELKLVVDTSSLIPELISFIRTGKSALYELTKGPFIKLYAPPKLIQEIEEKIPEISRKHKLDQNNLVQTWRQYFSTRIEISDTQSLLAFLFGRATVGKRDLEDVPFVALTFSLKTHGIVTRDKDIIEQPEIRIWKIGEARKVITIFKKGTFSFFISANFLVPLLQVIFQIGVSILRSLLELASRFVELSIGLIKGVINNLSKLPDWAKFLLGLAIIAMLAIEETRKKAIEFLQKMGEAVSIFLSQMYNLLKQLMEKIEPYVEFTLAMVLVLFNSIGESITHLQSIQSV
jgi:predicted nucleic acid-binding protein